MYAGYRVERLWDQEPRMVAACGVAPRVLYMIQKLNKGGEWLEID